MQEDGLTKLLLEALLCEDEQKREAIWQEALELETTGLEKQAETAKMKNIGSTEAYQND